MTWLTPTAGLLAAAVAAPLLLVLYLLRLRRVPVRVSSILLWQHTLHELQVNVPLRRLRPSVLLLLQALALACLCLAAARPAVTGGPAVAERVVIVIDRSASMSARDGRAARAGSEPVTRLDEAKRRALETLDDLERRAGGRPAVMVVEAGATARAATGFSRSFGAARRAISEVVPSDQPADLAPVLRLVAPSAGALRPADEEARTTPDTTVLVFSDGGLGIDPDQEPVPVPPGTEVRLVRVGPAPAAGSPEAVSGPANIGITALSARRDPENPAILRVFARLVNAGSAPAEASAQITVDGRLAQARLVTVPGTAAGAAEGQPGETALTFALENVGAALVGLKVTALGGDLLGADDSAAMVVAPPRVPGVLVIHPGTTPREADPFLVSALEELGVSLTLRPAGGPAPGTAADAGAAGAPHPALTVFDRVEAPTDPAGSSLMLAVAPALAGLGIEQIGDEPPGRILAWARTHQIMRSVLLDTLVVPAVRLRLPPAPPAAPGSDPALRATPLVWTQHGPVIALLEDPARATRHIVVAFDPRASNWPADASFPVFIANAVEFLTRGHSGGDTAQATTAQTLLIHPHPGAARVELSSPEGALVAWREVREPGVPVALGPIERVGVYSCRGGSLLGAGPEASLARGPEHLVPVGLLNSAESLLPARDRLALPVPSGAPLPDGPARGPALREVWPWLVLAALGFSTLEWILFAWQMRS
ncbi:MAG TPA: VWA domain-containing protein [Phycisphaerales bacterium]|nr:VWA domain-containing protein [Phycisphaerales bacterium]